MGGGQWIAGFGVNTMSQIEIPQSTFDWDRLNEVLNKSSIPHGSVTARDYARRYGVSRQAGGQALLKAFEEGFMERVFIKNTYYYTFKDPFTCPSGTPSSKSPAKSTSKSKPTPTGRLSREPRV